MKTINGKDKKHFFKCVVIEKTAIYILLNEKIKTKDHA